MNVVFAQERRPNIVDELLNVIRNSEARRQIAERENMQLREDNRRLNTQVRQLMQTNERPATRVTVGHSLLTNAQPRPITTRPVSPL